jgi:hypothetical protein
MCNPIYFIFMLSPRLTSAYTLQVENNAMEDGEGLGERDPALSLFSLDYSEECHDEEEEGPGDRDQYEGDEDDIRTRQKLNSVATISRLRFQPLSSSRFPIPLCRMLAMPMVRPTLTSDLAKLEQEFVYGYREGASVFYVTVTNEEGKTQEVTKADMASWDPIWRDKNEEFNSFLLSVPKLAGFTNLMFFVCDGNHMRQAWLNHIERLHKTDEAWHFLVDIILLETKGKIGIVMQVMHNINK